MVKVFDEGSVHFFHVLDDGAVGEVLLQGAMDPAVGVGVTAFDEDGEAVFVGDAQLPKGMACASRAGEELQDDEFHSGLRMWVGCS